MPTFRGGHDDWLDDVDDQSDRKAPKKIQDRAKTLAPEQGNATVAEVYPNQCAARLDGSSDRVLCGYRMSTLVGISQGRERSPVCVGDRVRVEAGVIVGRCERRNRLVRQAPNARDPVLHVLASNLDLLIIVAAARNPDFSPGIVDRFLVAASAQKIPAALVVNKTDLLEAGAARPWACYSEAGVALIEACAKLGDGVPEVLTLARGKATAFCGHSGVGKTSLLRKLLGDDAFGRVGTVSQASGMGRHTTTGAVLLPGSSGSTWIDTPGIMNFGLIDVEKKDLVAHFPELAAAAKACPIDCTHGPEPGCAIRTLARYESFRQIHAAL